MRIKAQDTGTYEGCRHGRPECECQNTHGRISVYLKDGNVLSYFRPMETMIEERAIWMRLLNDLELPTASFGLFLVPKDHINYVEFPTDKRWEDGG